MAHPPAPPRRILLLQGHPDDACRHLAHELAHAYAEGARSAGHEVRELSIAQLDFPLLRSADDWHHGPVPQTLVPAQEAIAWSQHVVLFFPLWLGDMPALLKAFLEQVARPAFAFGANSGEGNPFAHKALGGRSARVVVTMGMPAMVYRWVFRAHAVRALERNVLGFVGFAPVHETLIGGVEQLGEAGVARWCRKLRALGAEAS